MPRSSKIFRLFVSSTFADFKGERTAIQQKVFPVLEKLCQSYGAKFQAIDLRWGVSDEAQLDHKTLEICLNELKRCIDLSPKPNFLILMGDRYGWRPIPVTLTEIEYQACLHCANATQQELFKKWYMLDENSVPADYRLKARTGKYIDNDKWSHVEGVLRGLFDDVIEHARDKLSPDSITKFMLSATEHEIQHGAFQQQNAQEHVIAYLRKLDVENRSELPDFFDVTADGQRDTRSEQLLDNLQHQIANFIPAHNQLHATVESIEQLETSEYTDRLCEGLLERLIPLVESECKQITNMTFYDAEKQKHEQFLQERSKNFSGRSEFLQQIMTALQTTSTLPNVLYGVSGSGKSSIIAKCGKKLKKMYTSAHHIAHFIGASSFGLTSVEFLQSLICSLDSSKEKEIMRITSVEDLLDTYKETIDSLVRNVQYYILIDALDQLNDTQFLKMWLQITVPSNVKILCSIASDQPIFSALNEQLNTSQLIEMPPFSIKEGQQMLEEWLHSIDRTLQPKQMQLVQKSFEVCSLPLFVKLAFEEVKHWYSHTEVVDFPQTIEHMIEAFISKLTDNIDHGRELVAHTLGYINASRAGLGESELVQVLSQSKPVMDEFYERSKHDYIENKLPQVIWARLYNDLEPYLIEKKHENEILYSFYHRQIAEVIKNRFTLMKFHEELSNYYYEQPNYLDHAANVRKCFEAVYQSKAAKQLQRSVELVTDLDFIGAKYQAKLGSDLLDDYMDLKLIVSDEIAQQGVNDFQQFCLNNHVRLQDFPQEVLTFAVQSNGQSQCFDSAVKSINAVNGIIFLNSNPALFEKAKFTQSDQKYKQPSENGSFTFNINSLNVRAIAGNSSTKMLYLLVDKGIERWNMNNGKLEGQHFLPNNSNIFIEATSFNNALHLVGNYQYTVYDGETFEIIYTKTFDECIEQIIAHPAVPLVALRFKTGYVQIINYETFEKEVTLEKRYKNIAWHPMLQTIAALTSKNIEYRDAKTGDLLSSIQSPLAYNQLFSRIFKVDQKYAFGFSKTGDKILQKTLHNILVWDVKDGIRDDQTDFRQAVEHFIYNGHVGTLEKGQVMNIWSSQSYRENQKIALSKDREFTQIIFTSGHFITLDTKGLISINALQHNESNAAKIPVISDSVLWVLKPIVKQMLPITFLDLINDWSFNLAGVGQSKAMISMDHNLKTVKTEVSSNSQSAASMLEEGVIRLINYSENKTKFAIQPASAKTPILHMKLSCNGEFLVLANEYHIWVVNCTSGKVAHQLSYRKKIMELIISPTNEAIVIILESNEVKYRYLKNNKILTAKLPLNLVKDEQVRLSWNADGKRLAIVQLQNLTIIEFAQDIHIAMAGKASQPLYGAFWRADGENLYIIDHQFELLSLNINNQKVEGISQAIFNDNEQSSNERLFTLMDYSYSNALNNSKKIRINHYRSKLLKPLDKLNELSREAFNNEHYMEPHFAYEKALQILAISYGPWVKFIDLQQQKKAFKYYHSTMIMNIVWDGGKLHLFDQNQQKITLQAKI